VQHLPLPHRQHLLLSKVQDDNDDDNDDYTQDVQVGYRRPNIVQDRQDHETDDEPLSDYVVVRLAVARARAMARYRELHA
jgi:hypothetical protein